MVDNDTVANVDVNYSAAYQTVVTYYEAYYMTDPRDHVRRNTLMKHIAEVVLSVKNKTEDYLFKTPLFLEISIVVGVFLYLVLYPWPQELHPENLKKSYLFELGKTIMNLVVKGAYKGLLAPGDVLDYYKEEHRQDLMFCSTGVFVNTFVAGYLVMSITSLRMADKCKDIMNELGTAYIDILNKLSNYDRSKDKGNETTTNLDYDLDMKLFAHRRLFLNSRNRMSSPDVMRGYGEVTHRVNLYHEMVVMGEPGDIKLDAVKEIWYDRIQMGNKRDLVAFYIPMLNDPDVLANMVQIISGISDNTDEMKRDASSFLNDRPSFDTLRQDSYIFKTVVGTVQSMRRLGMNEDEILLIARNPEVARDRRSWAEEVLKSAFTVTEPVQPVTIVEHPLVMSVVREDFIEDERLEAIMHDISIAIDFTQNEVNKTVVNSRVNLIHYIKVILILLGLLVLTPFVTINVEKTILPFDNVNGVNDMKRVEMRLIMIFAVLLTITSNIESLLSDSPNTAVEDKDWRDVYKSNGSVYTTMKLFEKIRTAFKQTHVLYDAKRGPLAISFDKTVDEKVPDEIIKAITDSIHNDADGGQETSENEIKDINKTTRFYIKPIRSQVVKRSVRGDVIERDVFFRYKRTDFDRGDTCVVNASGLLGELCQYMSSTVKSCAESFNTDRSYESRNRMFSFIVTITVDGLTAVAALYYIYKSFYDTTPYAQRSFPDIALNVTLLGLMLALARMTFIRAAVALEKWKG